MDLHRPVEDGGEQGWSVTGAVADATVAAAIVSCVAVFLVGSPEPAFRFLVVFVLLLIPRMLRVPTAFRAGFGVALLAATWVGAAHWYDDAWWIDVVIHFFLPGASAVMLYFALARRDRLPNLDAGVFRRHASAVVIVVTALGLAVAALWEMYEWTALALFPSATIKTGYDDTILDLVMGGSGAAVASLALLWWARGVAERGSADLPGDG